MMRLTKGMMGLGLLMMFAASAGAFSLLGPLKDNNSPTFGSQGIDDPWQGAPYGGKPGGIGYSLAGDIGGPMLPTEAYRWNVPIITYAYDTTFLQYFGSNGVNAVEQAIAILNALPPASQMTPTLTEFPLDTRAENQTAGSLALLDLKSTALSFLLEEMGLANPERFVWGLRGRISTPNVVTNYSVIQQNYDPLTIQPSRYVNGVLYNYIIHDDLGAPSYASAVEWYQLDPLYQAYSSVAGGLGSPDLQLGSSPDSLGVFGLGLLAGQYFRGLTRDDAGGLRFLLSPNNRVFETLLPTVLPSRGGGGGSPWSPVLGTNVIGTNVTGISNILGTIGTNFPNFVRTALRPGVDKIRFQRVPIFGTNFAPITLRYTDRFFNPTNGRASRQTVERLVLVPDIIFDVRDLGAAAEFVPALASRTDTTGWTNNAAINSFLGGAGLGGPGTVVPPVVITFSDMVPRFLNIIAGGQDIEGELTKLLWGSFDGSDTPPVVYPAFPHPLAPQISLDYLRRVVLRRDNH